MRSERRAVIGGLLSSWSRSTTDRRRRWLWQGPALLPAPPPQCTATCGRCRGVEGEGMAGPRSARDRCRGAQCGGNRPSPHPGAGGGGGNGRSPQRPGQVQEGMCRSRVASPTVLGPVKHTSGEWEEGWLLADPKAESLQCLTLVLPETPGCARSCGLSGHAGDVSGPRSSLELRRLSYSAQPPGRNSSAGTQSVA